MEKLHPQDASEQDQIADSLQIKENIAWINAEVMADTSRKAFEIAPLLEVPSDPTIHAIVEKILKKCLDNHPGMQEALVRENMNSFKQNLFASHPELWNFATFDMKIHNFSCDNYADLTPMEKIQMITLRKAMYDMIPLPIWLKNKNWSYNIDQLKSRYNSKISSVVSDLLSTFKWDQAANLLNIKKTLVNDYWVSDADATHFEQYLEEVKKECEKNNVSEASLRGYVFAFIAGILVTVLWVVLYDKITNPRWMAEVKLDEIKLWDPSTLASLVTAEQPFEISGTRTESLYDTTADSSLVGRIAKDIINSAQSRTVTMSLAWKVWVEYNFNDWTTFTYNQSTQLITVELPYPSFVMRETKWKILNRDSELIEISKFDNTEQSLLAELNEKALLEAVNQEKLIDMSAGQAADIIYAIYSPILEAHKHTIKWVVVTIKWDSKGKREYLKG